jgi:hypothetical protein
MAQSHDQERAYREEQQPNEVLGHAASDAATP